MNIREFTKPVTSKTLNETLAKKFGARINVESFTLEQLQDVRNKVRTKVFNVQTTESFDAVQKETYQKNKLFLDVLNTAIAERTDVQDATLAEGRMQQMMKKFDRMMSGWQDNDYSSSPKEVRDNVRAFDDEILLKFLHKNGKVAGKGSPQELQQKVIRQELKRRNIEEQVKDAKNESIIKEGAEQSAEIVMAAKDMVDRVTGWMEDTAEMQTESMLELADAIRDEMGSEQSEGFTNTVKASLAAMYDVMETTRIALTQGVSLLTGEGEIADPMGADEAGLDDMEPTVDGELDPEMDAGLDDDFGAADASAGGDAGLGREKRESVNYQKKK